MQSVHLPPFRQGSGSDLKTVKGQGQEQGLGSVVDLSFNTEFANYQSFECEQYFKLS